MDFAGLREAVESVGLVDAHAHNIVGLNSDLPFITCFTEANGQALTFAPHSLSFKHCQVQTSKDKIEKMDFARLKETVDRIGLVDSHAHNIVGLNSDLPFITCFTEANGQALTFAPSSLSFKRNLRDIAELYGCEVSLDGVEEYRKSAGIESISSMCFKHAKISAVLIDDGIEFDQIKDIQWHKSFVPVVHRILRIEHLAEKIIAEMQDGSACTLDKFIGSFLQTLRSFAGMIVGLKSIAAYRSGLEINTQVTEKDAAEGLAEILQGGKPFRISNKSFIDFIFTRSLEFALEFDLPLQIHTGFGDKDLDLRLSNPLHLRAVLEDPRFSKSRIVLLHASYPFSKEASYLASVYPQVYVDFGLAIPKLSVHGMISSVKELLELTPIKKVMFSTDAYAFPETFYLGGKKSREVIFSVLRDACIDGDLTVTEAIKAAKGILAEHAIEFYKIGLGSETIFSDSYTHSLKRQGDDQVFDASFVRIIWVDASGQHRCRVVPAKRFDDIVKRNGVGLTFACMAMPSFIDAPVDNSGLTGVGEFRLMPDLSTKCRIPWVKKEEMVIGDMNLKPGESWEYCPREALRRVIRVLKDEFDLVMNAGFENEFYLLKSVEREGKDEWVPFDSSSYCSTSAFDAASPLLQEVIDHLNSLNITVEQVHAEAGDGQFEIALGHTSCFTAADNLIYTREVTRAVAKKHGLLATFSPKYTLADIGSGSHVHVSLWQNGKNVFSASEESSRYGMSKTGEEFMAGVLFHLPAILAFTAPHPNSYDRIQPNTWSGAYQCWGQENRESPIRTACPPGINAGFVSNFEIKSFDACANPYLGLAAIVAAGIDGLRRHLQLPEPVDINPAMLDAELKRLPTSLSESVEALEKDNIFKDFFSEKLLTAIKAIRKAEIDYHFNNKDAYKQLIRLY